LFDVVVIAVIQKKGESSRQTGRQDGPGRMRSNAFHKLAGVGSAAVVLLVLIFIRNLDAFPVVAVVSPSLPRTSPMRGSRFLAAVPTTPPARCRRQGDGWRDTNAAAATGAAPYNTGLASTYSVDGSEYRDSPDNNDPGDDSEDFASLASGYGRSEFGDDDEEGGDAPTVELTPVPISKNSGNRFVALVWDRDFRTLPASPDAATANAATATTTVVDWHRERIRHTEDHVMFCRKQNLYNATYNTESMVDIPWSYQMYVCVSVFVFVFSVGGCAQTHTRTAEKKRILNAMVGFCSVLLSQVSPSLCYTLTSLLPPNHFFFLSWWANYLSFHSLSSDLQRVIGHAMCMESTKLEHVYETLGRDPYVQHLIKCGDETSSDSSSIQDRVSQIPLYRWRHIKDYTLRRDDGRDGFPCLCLALDHDDGTAGNLRDEIKAETLEFLIRSERIIATGPLHLPTEFKDDPSSFPTGDLILFNARDRDDAIQFVESLPTAMAGLYKSMRVHFYNQLDVTGKFVSEDPLRDAPCADMREALEHWGYPVDEDQTAWLNW
jgi:uncharacterized protein YciI